MTAVTGRPSPQRRQALRRQALRRRSRREALWFWALAGPNLLLILVFTYRPVLTNAYFSTLDWTLGSPTATPVGLRNYVEFFTSGTAPSVLGTTVVFAVTTVGGAMVLGLLLALALNTRVRGSGLARAAVFSPYVLSGVGVGLVWLFIMDPVIGVLGAVLRALGGSSPAWFNDPHLTLTMVVIVYVWKNLGYAAVVYLAGLQAIDPEVLEAAALDGAGPVRRLLFVVVPLLSPTTFFLLVTTALSSLQAFDLLKIMSPLGRGTDTLVYEAYLQAFAGSNRAGYSAALSTVLFVVLAGLTAFQLLVLEKRVHYR